MVEEGEYICNALRYIRKKGDADVARNAVVDDVVPELVDRSDEDSDNDNMCDDDPNETEKKKFGRPKESTKKEMLDLSQRKMKAFHKSNLRLATKREESKTGKALVKGSLKR